MSIWNRLLGIREADEIEKTENPDSSKYAFADIEVGNKDVISDIGALRYDGAVFHKNSKNELNEFLDTVDYVCGHNFIHHDAKYLFPDGKFKWRLVDTLYMSPIIFPAKPYHKLLKDDKLIVEQLNNPVNDCEKAKELLFDEVSSWNEMPVGKQILFTSLLRGVPEFDGFLDFVGAVHVEKDIPGLIRELFEGKICSNAALDILTTKYKCELAYALAIIDTSDYHSVTPGWVLHTFPQTEWVIGQLTHKRCLSGCAYCDSELDIHRNLKKYFGYDQFRVYDAEPLQEKSVQAAVNGESLLAIFPTGGGKSLTFQLPALIAGHCIHGLTVVISPLQSLMKDQVDNLINRGIYDAVTINGLLDPIERAESIRRVMDGDVSMLYISPEMLRSNTIERVLMKRTVVRFVIDEAHCFSAWGQDFRVDYLYIGRFIKKYQESKQLSHPIPVSCFTATAKQKVIQDISDYFKNTLGLTLGLFASKASRTNLRYSVIHSETDEDKYLKLRELIADSDCPVIVYVSRTKRTEELSSRLTRDGFQALPFNGKMDSDTKVANQEAFMSDKVRIIVATSAFGMGVDKSDVGLVIHYDISDSLENYVQEAGRAGRDPQLDAKCYVLYNDNDLDKHFILLNQTKLSLSEIQHVWQAVKNLTRKRMKVQCSALEIARMAGWDDSVNDIETRVKTALAALEQSGYINRGKNVPRVYATSIAVNDVEQARKMLEASSLFDDEDVVKALRIIKSLISKKYIAKAGNADAEARVDYLADILGFKRQEVISLIGRMRQARILADSQDMTAFLMDGANSERKAAGLLECYAKLEKFILESFSEGILESSYRQLNQSAVDGGITSSREKDIKSILYFLTVKGYICRTDGHSYSRRDDNPHNISVKLKYSPEAVTEAFERRIRLSAMIAGYLYDRSADSGINGKRIVQFSVVELLEYLNAESQQLFHHCGELQLATVEEVLLYMSMLDVLKIEGGFIVLYNAMTIERLKENKYRYKVDDYKNLNDFYKQKIQQIHIVGEYANLMVKDYDAALEYVQDYFQMDYRKFISKYFKGDRSCEIERNLTPGKFKQLFGQLSERQMEIISDKESRCIVVAAGPGSGKTRVLVHKLASLLLLEDVKHEQLLMLTFSRAAAMEFKQRLIDLIGNAAHYVDIKTFHSYCFDLLGRMGNIEDVPDVVKTAVEMIAEGEVEPTKIKKSVLVIDEAQDMSEVEYQLVKALMANNEDMRVIAVGDDDQNIYEFRGSDSKYFYSLSKEQGGRFLEMTENYRSASDVVEFANVFLKKIDGRLKTSPIVSRNSVQGHVQIVKHKSEYMYLPVVQRIRSRMDKGSTCVLTKTNEEALIFVALMRKYGLNAKLIQTLDDVAFWNLAEMRYFLKTLQRGVVNSLISNDLWDRTKEKTFKYYEGSTSLEYVRRCVELFETANKVKYFSDFKEYVFESSVEDFCSYGKDDIVVSTIHKSKGKEFDNVYMIVSGGYKEDAKMLRRYYVGITRAKVNLYIHTDGDCFSGLQNAEFHVENKEYTLPDEILLQLTHRDVFLGYFKSIKSDVLALRGGDDLDYRDYTLFSRPLGKSVAKLSKRMKEVLDGWSEKGYDVVAASVRFVMAWKPKDAEKGEQEYAVLLADLKLRRKTVAGRKELN